MPQILAEIEKNSTSEIAFSPVKFLDVFVLVYALMGLFEIEISVLNILSAKSLTLRENYTFSLVIAAINCFQVLFGSILRISIFIVLSSDSVRKYYE